jgi:hypothetical protein
VRFSYQVEIDRDLAGTFLILHLHEFHMMTPYG